jgi:hypothetical protein
MREVCKKTVSWSSDLLADDAEAARREQVGRVAPRAPSSSAEEAAG